MARENDYCAPRGLLCEAQGSSAGITVNNVRQPFQRAGPDWSGGKDARRVWTSCPDRPTAL